MTVIRILFFVTLLFVTGYFIVKFFSKLSGIDMIDVLFHSRGSFPYALAVIFCYVIFFVLYYLFFMTPFKIHEMRDYHEGGLLGYCDKALHAMVYDPHQNDYISYYHIHAPLPANKFTETFKVIFFYRPPSKDYYRDSRIFNFSTALIEILIGSTMLFVLYLVLFKLANQYGEISHQLMLTRFKDVTGLPLGRVLIIALLLIIIVVGLNLITANNIRSHYKNRYGTNQERLRNELLSKVSPQDTLEGVVIRRFWERKSQTRKTNLRGRDNQLMSHRTETDYFTVFHYTIEFKNLIGIPVYLGLEVHELSDDNKVLSKSFEEGSLKSVPDNLQELTFVVNPDYSISLKMDNDAPEK